MSVIGSVMSRAAMSAPASANALAWLKPCPLAAPVIRTFLPSRPRSVALIGSPRSVCSVAGDRVPLRDLARAAVLRRPPHRVDDHVVAGAAAQVALDAVPDGVLVRVGVLQQQTGRRQH